MPRKPRYDTEARQRKAIRMVRAGTAEIDWPLEFMNENEPIVWVVDPIIDKVIATFDLSKFPGMRKGLKGVKKLQKDLKRVTR